MVLWFGRIISTMVSDELLNQFAWPGTEDKIHRSKIFSTQFTYLYKEYKDSCKSWIRHSSERLKRSKSQTTMFKFLLR